MIYFIAFYFATVFTSFLICGCIAYKFIVFVKKNNLLSQHPTQPLPRINLKFTFSFFLDSFITILFMSVFLGWKIVYKTLFSDDFITKSAFKIYIEILLEVKNDL